jgi:hypothetical protein
MMRLVRILAIPMVLILNTLSSSSFVWASGDSFEQALLRVKTNVAEKVGSQGFRQAQRDVLISAVLSQQGQLLQLKLDSELAVMREAVLHNDKETIQKVNQNLDRLSEIAAQLRAEVEARAAKINQNPQIIVLNDLITEFISETKMAKQDFSAEGPINFWIIDLDQREMTEHDEKYLKNVRELSSELKRINQEMKVNEVSAQKIVTSTQNAKQEIQSIKESLKEEMSASQKEEAENRIRKLEQQIKSHELDFMLYSEESQKLKAAAQEMMKKWMLDQQEAIQRALKKAEVSAKDQARAIIESLDNKTTSQACREF